MLIEVLERFSTFENQITKESQTHKFKRINKAYIKADSFLVFLRLIRKSDYSLLPSLNPVAWLKGLKNRNFKNLFGAIIQWIFIKKVSLPVQADIVYFRPDILILIYTSISKPCVVKIPLGSKLQGYLKQETEKLSQASKFRTKDVYIPKIINTHFDNDSLVFSVEEYFSGRRQNLSDIKRLKFSYQKVFDFMINYYLNHPIELKVIDTNDYKIFDDVKYFFDTLPYGEQANQRIKSLINPEKKLILCRVHNDLNHNNVLTGKNQVAIIDWADSQHTFISQDLRTSYFNTKDVFAKFISKAVINPDIVYSHSEQILLGDYLMLVKLASKYISRKQKKERRYLVIKKRLKQIATRRFE